MLTERQELLLKAIIEEFMQTACAVGSIDLPTKYNLNVSPATIRNEMAKLVEMGYLEKPHSSSGRIPTTTAFRLFLQELIDELEELAVQEEAQLNERIFQNRFDLDNLFITIVKNLAELTDNAAIALINHRIYRYGLDKLIRYPEFQDFEVLQQVLNILDDYSKLYKILKLNKKNQNIRILIGEEFQNEYMKKMAIVFASIKSFSANKEAYIAVFGPNRMNYKKIIPVIKLITEKISSVLMDWQEDFNF